VNRADSRITHVGQGVLDSFSLRINDRLFGGDNDFCFQTSISNEAMPQRESAQPCELTAQLPFFKSRRGFPISEALKG